MKKRIITFIIAAALAIGTLLTPGGTASASATTVAAVTATTGRIDTTSGDYYIVKSNNTPIKMSTSKISGNYGKLTKDTLIQTCGSSGDHYKVNLNGTIYYIEKNKVKAAGESFFASLCYVTKDSAIRATPVESGAKIETAKKSTLLITAGTLINSKNNKWNIVYHQDSHGLLFIYSGNVKSVDRVSLTVSGDTNTMNICETVQLTANISPTTVKGVEWSSSNPRVAKVSANGLVTTTGAGRATIYASVCGVFSATYVIEVTSKVELGVPFYSQKDPRWANTFIGSKTIGNVGCLVTSISMLHSYRTHTQTYPNHMVNMLKFTGNCLIYNSVNQYGYTYVAHNGRVNNSVLTTIYNQLKQRKPVVIGGYGHWVICTGYIGNSTENFSASDFTINDPGWTSRTKLSDHLASFPKIEGLIY